MDDGGRHKCSPYNGCHWGIRKNDNVRAAFMPPPKKGDKKWLESSLLLK